MKSFQALALFSAVASAQMVMEMGPPATGAMAPVAGAGTTHMVVVGGASLEFTPNFVMAAPGDTVRFMFLQKNHSVEQSAFATPCVRLATGANSGFKPNPNGDMATAPFFDVPVTSTEALWMYCGQTGHCSKGMVFAVNPTQEKSLAAFRQLALATNGTGVAAAPGGAATLAAIQQNPPQQIASTITFGTELAAPTAAVAGAGNANVAVGQGVGGAGVCQCSCLCGPGSFTNPADGIGMFGGVGGEMPLAAMSAPPVSAEVVPPAPEAPAPEAAALPAPEAPPAPIRRRW